MLRKILFSLFLLSPSLVIAAELPFSDVSPDVSYYADLKHMYNAWVIGDTADHLFRPNGLLPRDEFVGIVVGVSCRKCIEPSLDDIIRYKTNPFVDILKKNQYFYCISYAKEKEIVRGYVLDSTGNTQCQNGQNFKEVPFCPVNSISRIEAAAVLLRQAGLWTEVLNSSAFEKKMTLSDVDTYWYGYAQKAIQSGLITTGANNKIFPNEYITRKEFVVMASKIFTINMCSVKNDSTPHEFASIIKIYDKEKQNCSESNPVTTFPNNTETTYDFGGYSTGNLNPPLKYDWTFVNNSTWEQRIATASCLDNYNLGSSGSWLAKLVITDSSGQSSTAYQQVAAKGNGLSVQIGTSRDPLKTSATTLRGIVDIPMPFFSTTTGWDGHYTYHWDFSDGWTSVEKDPLHAFAKEGIYPVSFTVRDTAGNIAYAQLTVIIISNPDRDGDGVFDYDASRNILDLCPLVRGPASNRGCPLLSEHRIALGSDVNNLCLVTRIKNSGIIEWALQCTSCPCIYSSEFIAQVRSCDVIFPSITSPDKKTLYSRGKIFAVP